MFALRRDERARLLLFGVVLLVHAAFWLLALSLRQGLASPRQVFAEVLSTSALVLMSLNLMLSTRVAPLERFLYGLDKLFVTHRVAGMGVALFAMAHFTIVPRSEGFVITKAFSLPTFFALLGAIFAATAPRFPWRRLVPLKYHQWKASHRFMGVFVVGAVVHSLLAVTYVRQVPWLTAYVYGAAGLGLMAWVYRELRLPYLRHVTTHRVRLFRTIGDISEVTLFDAQPPRTAGQFGVLSLCDGPTREEHPFTISSGSGEPYRFSIKSSGDYTARLLQEGVATGSGATVEGPYGAFDYRRGKTEQLWVAGGIGITPFLAMAADLDDTRRVFLIWSVHDRSEAVFEEELARLSESRANLRVLIHSSSELGHLDLSAAELTSSPRDYSAFICGPHPMRVSLVRQLRRMGVARNEIYFEEFRLR